MLHAIWRRYEAGELPRGLLVRALFDHSPCWGRAGIRGVGDETPNHRKRGPRALDDERGQHPQPRHAVESAVGMLMFGWSTALLVRVVQRTDRDYEK